MDLIGFQEQDPPGLNMKFALVLALLAVVQANNVSPEDNTVYDYLARYGLPLAERIRAAEESGSRIVGGSEADQGQYPWQAGLLVTFPQGRGACGGSLISANRALTAAHCWYDGRNQASQFEVVLGSNTLFTGGFRVNTSDVVVHSGWNPSTIRNDVCVIRLGPEVTLSNEIVPISLPSGSQLKENYSGEIAIASGFGITSDGDSISSTQALSHVELKVISNLLCSFYFPFSIHSTHVCTSGADGRSTCSGDSGGPLVINRNGQPILIGITSFGSAFGCEVGFPAVFTRVSSFVDFINQQL